MIKNSSNIEARGDAMVEAMFFSNIGGSKSGPPADFSLSFLRIFKTPGVVKFIPLSETLSGTRDLMSGIMLVSKVNTDAKKSLKQLAWVTGSEIRLPKSSLRAPMPDLHESFWLAYL